MELFQNNDGSGGALGYGIINSQGVIVTSTHKGILDSELQSNAKDPVFHNHYVLLGSNPAAVCYRLVYK